ncbi:hypothetical protein ACJX0J_026402, partial [Zea mays]
CTTNDTNKDEMILPNYIINQIKFIQHMHRQYKQTKTPDSHFLHCSMLNWATRFYFDAPQAYSEVITTVLEGNGTMFKHISGDGMLVSVGIANEITYNNL